MTLEISPIDIFDIFSISTAFMLGLMFITFKSKNNRANIFLGLFLWSLSVEVLVSFLDGQQIETSIYSSGMLTLILLFFYVIITLNYSFKAIYMLSVIPIIGEFTQFIPEFILNLFGVLILTYILVILHEHQKKLGDYYSELENRTLSWIKAIVYFCLFFYFLWIIEDLVGIKYENAIQYFALISTFLTLVLIYWIGYKGFLQPEIFNFSILLAKKNESIQKETEEPQKVSVSESNTSKYSVEKFNMLSKQIQNRKLYLQKDLTIRDLSRMINTTEKEFSRLINVYTQKNFYHYINQFRINEFKRLLKTDKANKLSLLGLSKEAGFSSKSTFYSVFKATQGITPKQYLDQINKYE